MNDDMIVSFTGDETRISKEGREIIESEKQNIKKYASVEVSENENTGMIKVASFDAVSQAPYSSPYLNLSDSQIPNTTKEIFDLCKYYYTFDPIVAGAINARANFPVTEIYFEDKAAGHNGEKSETCAAYEKVFFQNINIYKLLVEIGIDYDLYGNCFIFGEMYTNPVTKQTEWKSMIRLDPSNITIDYDSVTGIKKYKWDIPANVVQIIKDKKPKDTYDKIPKKIVEAVNKNGAVVLNSNNVYHFARPTDSKGIDSVWGTPLIANVLKLLMYRNVLRQAQEAIAREHIVPMRVYYIQKTPEYAPETDWGNVAQSFAGELMKSVRDPNHKVVSPVPVGVLNVGGDGRSLLLTPEIEQTQNEILAGMNVPREFIFGGVSYSGSSVSLKILENQFITYRLLVKDFLQNFCIKKMAHARKEWESELDDDKLLRVKLNDLKMQDDVQQKQIMLDLNRNGKVPDSYMYKVMGLDADKMADAIKNEAIAKIKRDAAIQRAQMESDFESQKLQIKQQMELQLYQQELARKFGMAGDSQQGQQPMQGQQTQEQQTQEQQAPENQQEMLQKQQQQQQGENIQPQQQATQEQQQTPQQQQAMQESQAQQISRLQETANQLYKLPKEQQEYFLSKLPQQQQQYILRFLEEIEQQQLSQSVDMRPMPEKLPPRRNSLK